MGSTALDNFPVLVKLDSGIDIDYSKTKDQEKTFDLQTQTALL